MADAGSDKTYEDLVDQDQVEAIMSPEGGAAVIDFWSPSCGPCMAMASDFAHVAGQFDPEEVRFCKVNTASHGYLAAPFKIMSVPTILFVLDGEVLDAVVGRMDAKRLGSRAEWLLKKRQRRGKGLLGRLFG
ncbi:Thioredoxin-2 [Enhygromyxa salina]|uniref:Thioredoxin-2 n=1 Tax=Enhygromyxa salina TaxID=215803 RepID=A0A2S9XCR6_9BACT|nr:thioredoxin family protein [Enhygromyxa salina]PRP90653.1 Thioredoxin-2 [Enhygromyxa salina]